MSDVLAVASPPPRKRRMLVRTAGIATRRRHRIAIVISLLALLAAVAPLFPLKPDDRALASPMLALVVTTIVFMMVLWSRDGSPPVFEAGALCMLAITLYGTYPLIGFLLMQGQWDPFADGRLQWYPFNAAELGTFGWRYVVYALAFSVTYLGVRGRAAVKTTAFEVPKRVTLTAVLITFSALCACKIVLRLVYDYDPDDVSYADPIGSGHPGHDMPYLVLQIGHNALYALFVVQLAVIVLLLAWWRKRWCRYALFLWLAWEVVSTVIRMGPRGKAVLLLISTGVLYHRLVKRLSFRALAVGGSLLLTGFLIVGSIRGVQSGDARMEQVKHILTGANEFQGLFTTGMDIHKRKEAGELGPVPWQLYVSDFYFPIPSQLLPFEKIDPSSWYIDEIGQTGTGIGFMFGVMSQAAVGLDWIELVLRGAVLAVCLALLHRWYVRHSTYFWPTLLYLFISIWAYYTFRASTFFFVYFVIYHFIPVLLATKLIELLLSRVRRGSIDPQPVVAGQ